MTSNIWCQSKVEEFRLELTNNIQEKIIVIFTENDIIGYLRCNVKTGELHIMISTNIFFCVSTIYINDIKRIIRNEGCPKLPKATYTNAPKNNGAIQKLVDISV